MPRTLKTLLEDVYTYFVATPYPVGKRGNSCFAILDNCVVEVAVEEDCSEFAIIFNKRVDKDHHIAWARFSRDNYKEANKYFDFLIETIKNTADGGHVCEEMIEYMGNRISKYIKRKEAQEDKK